MNQDLASAYALRYQEFERNVALLLDGKRVCDNSVMGQRGYRCAAALKEANALISEAAIVLSSVNEKDPITEGETV